MPDPTITRRATKNRERERREGLVRVEVRVPAERADEIKAIAAEMRRGFPARNVADEGGENG
ncbi:MAG: hypothetical protein VXW57_05045 [Pseudomonadota bacterium]|nr:hypothetical protein [Pseudomonadota bacterium]